MDLNLPTILISAVIIAVFLLIVVKGIINRKQGKSSCGCNCEGCAMKGNCHPEKEAKN